eukprot:gene6630-8202_t
MPNLVALSIDSSKLTTFTLDPENTPNLNRLSFTNTELETIPQRLPKQIYLFECERCGLNGTIPSSWVENELLSDININYNYFNGEFPEFLVKRLDRCLCSSNEFNGTLDKFLNVKPYSFWELSYNNFSGNVPNDFEYLVNSTYLNFESNKLEGPILKHLYCNPDYFKFGDNPLLILNSSILEESTSSINYCFSPDPYQIDYTTPSPPNGGVITISSARFTSRLLQLFKTKPLGLTLPEPNEEFDQYQYFLKQFGNVFLNHPNLDPRVEIKCRLISFKPEVECIINADEIRDFKDLINMELFTEKEGFLDFEFPFLNIINAPIVSSITKDIPIEGGVVEIKGENFGFPYQEISVTLENPLDSNEKVNCPITFRNQTFITCNAPKLNNNGNIIFNSIVKVGHQNSIETLKLNYKQNEILSDCFGESNEICNGKGLCQSSNCVCNSGYTGVFCELESSKFEKAMVKVNETHPISLFTHEQSTINFEVDVIEIREIDFRSKVIKRSKPTWTRVSSNGNTHVYSSPLNPTNEISNLKSPTTRLNNYNQLVDESKVLVTLNYFESNGQVNFANSTVNVEGGNIKYSVHLEKYPFQTSLNYLQVVFRVGSMESEKMKDLCALVPDGKIGNDPNLVDIKWMTLDRGNSGLTCKIFNRAIVDKKIIYTKFHMETVSANEVYIIANVPHFKESSTIDPNYGVLINPSKDKIPKDSKCGSKNQTTTKLKDSKWKIAVSVVVPTIKIYE